MMDRKEKTEVGAGLASVTLHPLLPPTVMFSTCMGNPHVPIQTPHQFGSGDGFLKGMANVERLSNSRGGAIFQYASTLVHVVLAAVTIWQITLISHTPMPKTPPKIFRNGVLQTGEAAVISQRRDIQLFLVLMLAFMVPLEICVLPCWKRLCSRPSTGCFKNKIFEAVRGCLILV